MEHHRFTLPSIIIEKSKSPLRCWQVEEPLAIQKQRDCSLISSLSHFPRSSPGAPGGMGMDGSGSGADYESDSDSEFQCCFLFSHGTIIGLKFKPLTFETFYYPKH